METYDKHTFDFLIKESDKNLDIFNFSFRKNIIFAKVHENTDRRS